MYNDHKGKPLRRPARLEAQAARRIPPLLRLPTELRLMVYNYALPSSRDRNPRMDGDPIPPLMQVCCLIREEARDVVRKRFHEVLATHQATYDDDKRKLDEFLRSFVPSPGGHGGARYLVPGGKFKRYMSVSKSLVYGIKHYARRMGIELGGDLLGMPS